MELVIAGIRFRFSRRTIIAALIFTVAVSAAASGSSEDYDEYLEGLYRNTVETIEPNELAAMLESGREIVMLDTRTEAERAVSYIEGSKFIDFDMFSLDEIDKIDKDSIIITYCAVGYRSERIGQKLLEAGYSDVRHLYGGIIEWQNDGQALTRGPTHPNTESTVIHGYAPKWGRYVASGAVIYEPKP